MVKFYKCKECKSMVLAMNAKGVCCASSLEEVVANTVDASKEKHVPVILENKNGKVLVNVGSVLHPMTPEHLIDWIYIETNKGGAFRYLSASDEPKAEFALASDEKLVAVYAYCNLHGLWMINA